MKVLQKNELKNGYYYSGYVNQLATVLSNDQQKIVGMWDTANDCFWFWEYEGNRKTKSRLNYLSDNEIEFGFFPVKVIFPKEDELMQ